MWICISDRTQCVSIVRWYISYSAWGSLVVRSTKGGQSRASTSGTNNRYWFSRVSILITGLLGEPWPKKPMPMKLWLKYLYGALLLFCSLVVTSCGKPFEMYRVNYQSVRTTFAQPESIPVDAKVAVQYYIDKQGAITAIVYNLTDEILNIDQTKSFFVNTNGQSASYYDPAVKTTTTAEQHSNTSAGSLNLGALASSLGIGGRVGTLLNGATVGKSNTVGSYESTTITIQDLPTVSVGPHGKMAMSKQYYINGVGNNMPFDTYVDIDSKTAPLKFSICISYSFEDSGYSDKLITNFYVNSNINYPLSEGNTSDGFKRIYSSKPDALAEYIYLFKIDTSIEPWQNGIYKEYTKGTLFDYK